MHPTKAYVLFTILWGAGMSATATTYVPGLLERGFTLSEVAAVNMFFWLTISLMELPTGLLADGRSRAWSVRIGALFFVAGAMSYFRATTFAQAAFSETVFGIGFAFLSGAQQAWLADALKKRGESGELRRAYGTAAAWRSIAAMVAGVGGAFIGTIDLRYGWLLGGTFHACAAAVAFLAMNGEDGEPHADEKMTEGQAFSASLKATRAIPGLLWALGMATAFGLVLPFNHFWTPFFRERVGQVGLSVVYALFHLGLAAGGMAVRRGGLFSREHGSGVVVAVGLTGAGLAVAGFMPGIALPFLATLVHELGRGMFDPLMDAYVQQRVGSGYRATYASFQSLIARAGYGVILGVVVLATRGQPSNGTTIGWTWLAAGGLLTAVAFAGWRWRRVTAEVPSS
ncbi:MAG TPA: MFS transporter [Candidatus Binatia bacterium]|jgi:MFS family permease|nr:MFS transporter [Candidatus Binatia bacterium]